MKKIINSFLFYSKIILLLIAFTLTLYIIFSMNAYYRRNVINIILVGIPLFLVLLMFVLSIFKDTVKDNLFFNLASVLSIVAIIIIDYRTIFDSNMVLWIDSKMNFLFSLNSVIVSGSYINNFFNLNLAFSKLDTRISSILSS